MSTYELAVAVTTTGLQPPVDVSPSITGRERAVVQIEFTSTGSVTIEGRVDPYMSWQTIGGPYTADMIDTIVTVPQMLLNISSNAGSITAKVVVP